MMSDSEENHAPPSVDTNNPVATGDVALSQDDLTPMERGESAASFPNAEEVRSTVYGDREKGSGKSCKWVLLTSLVLLAAVALSVGLGVGLTNRENSQQAAASSSSGGSSSTKAPPQFDGEDTQITDTAEQEPVPRLASYSQIKDYVVQNGISRSTDFMDAVSPQNRAASWMAELDGGNLAVPSVSVNSGEIDAYRFMARYVMAVLYYATDGENWKFQFNFLTEGDVCSWKGALVDATGMQYIPFGTFCNSQGEIWGIYLDRIGLQGSIPEEIGMLESLELLDLTFNDGLGGEFPPAICQLTNLKALYLGYTQLQGQLPDCIGALNQVASLFLSDTLMEGPLPASMAQMTAMQKLLLDDNAFSGDITTLLNGMVDLQYLFIEDNDLTATIDENFLANHEKIMQIDISSNDIEGRVPAHLFDASMHPILQLIDMHDNRLEGPLPELTNTSEKMLFVALQRNSLSGAIPDSWTTFLPNLFHLDLSSNMLDGPMLPAMGGMNALRYLFLANNPFEAGPIPDTFANLTRMEEFSVKLTNRNGAFPTFIATDWPELVLLDVDNNAISGQLPTQLGNLTKLEFLLVNRNQLSGPIPAELGNLIQLRAVFLEQNQLTGQLDDSLCALPAFALEDGIQVGNQVLVADCGDQDGIAKLVTCSCCTICCTNGLENCHDENEIANLNPQWEIGYGRFSYSFGNETRFIDRDFAVGT